MKNEFGCGKNKAFGAMQARLLLNDIVDTLIRENKTPDFLEANCKVRPDVAERVRYIYNKRKSK